MPANLGAPFGKFLVVLGVIIAVAGLLLIGGFRFGSLRIGRLPGDIAYKGKHGSLYFPVATCIVISAGLTLIFWLISFFSKR
ncbi:MAG: DUF2905 domain-containing protein [Terriglobia bacterium]